MKATEHLWPDIRTAYGWIRQATALLANPRRQTGAEVHASYSQLVAQIRAQREQAGALTSALDHFLKVTQSYAPGLFHCYDVAGLPRTNNDLEHVFGRLRYQEPRASGRKQAAPAMVVRGSVRLIAVVVTAQGAITAEELQPRDLARWRALRQDLEYRQDARRAQRRFRRDPERYLAALEEQLLWSTLPA